MNLFTKFIVESFTLYMRKNDLKVKRTLPVVEGVSKYLSINYASNNSKDFRKMNIYKKDGLGKAPLIIDIHGGGWIYGDKDLNDEYASYLASKGFYVITFSYRLLTHTNLKGMVSDIFTFMHYIYDHKDEYQLDFDNVMLVGDSAGAHLSLLTLAINSSSELQKIYEVKPFDFKIDFLTLEHPCPFLNEVFVPDKATNRKLNKMLRKAFYKGVSEDLKNNASLDEFGKYLKNCPPMLIVSCSKDDLNRFYFRTLSELDNLGIKYETKFYEGLFHVFEVLKYNLPESIEFNDYSIEMFKKIIESKGEANEK